MATVIVIGAGLGGMSAAYELKAELGKQHEVILINDKPDFEFTPSNPWIAVQWRERKETSIPIEPHVKKKGIRFIHAALTELFHQGVLAEAARIRTLAAGGRASASTTSPLRRKRT